MGNQLLVASCKILQRPVYLPSACEAQTWVDFCWLELVFVELIINYWLPLARSLRAAGRPVRLKRRRLTKFPTELAPPPSTSARNFLEAFKAKIIWFTVYTWFTNWFWKGPNLVSLEAPQVFSPNIWTFDALSCNPIWWLVWQTIFLFVACPPCVLGMSW